MTEPLVRLSDVSKSFHRGSEEIHALRSVWLDFYPGKFVVVSGPSGSGKSTLLHVCAGLDQPDSGSVAFRGQDVFALDNDERARFRRQNIGFVFQFFNLVPTLTAVQNVSLPLLLDGVAKAEADERAASVLGELGMGERLKHKPAEMSGGQMQRVAVARALVANPPLVLADEPTGNLDSESGAEVLRLLKEASAHHDAAVIMVTHDPEAAAYGDYVVTLHDGNVLSYA